MGLPRYASAAVRPHAHTRVTREGYPSNETFAIAAECVDHAGPGAGAPMLGAYFTWQPSPQSGAIRHPDVLETTERRRQTWPSCSCGLHEKAAYHSQCRAAITFGVASFRGSNNIVQVRSLPLGDAYRTGHALELLLWASSPRLA
jgi:hypothetical protein